jgi:hypothetical protein
MKFNKLVLESNPGMLKPGQDFNNHTGHTVINISDIILTTAQVEITFCPTPGYPDISQIWLDFKDFHRRLELHQFFAEQDTPNSAIDKFTPKSMWRPPVPNKTLEAYKAAVRNDLLQCNPQKSFMNNITKEQYQGLRSLTNNPHIVIKKADKGPAVVVTNTVDYLREGYRQLQDSNFYQKLDHDPTEKYATEINLILLEMLSLNLITNKNYEYFKPVN